MKFQNLFAMGGLKFLIFALLSLGFAAAMANVTYDRRALVIDGKRKILIGGSIHYPRSTPEMWPDLIQKAKDGGLNAIDTYVFWSEHEPVQNKFDFKGRNDLVKFIKTVADAGLYVILRIGPYVCAEWNYGLNSISTVVKGSVSKPIGCGGFPVWLHFVRGIRFRTDNEPFKAAMQRFTAKIVDMMKKEKLLASQGGPIVLLQVENEYGDIQKPYGAAGKRYVTWAANMATSLNAGVPWVMCQQKDAPDPIINTCNGFYCDQFTPNSNQKPIMWTENWIGWYQGYGESKPRRPVEDIAFAVARFYQNGGTLQTYYMYQGGTNFGRTSANFFTTSYDYDAPIDEYGLLRQPKWGHLKDLHKAIKLCEDALAAVGPASVSHGPNLEATVYETDKLCSAFLANVGSKSDANITFRGRRYLLAAWSVSILPDCKNVVLNTAKINAVTAVSRFTHQDLQKPSEPNINMEHTAAIVKDQSGFDSVKPSQLDWSTYCEPIGISMNKSFERTGLLEQINTTADKSDYLWYSVSIRINGGEPFLHDGSNTTLHVQSLGHAFHVFVNGNYTGSGFGNQGHPKLAIDFPISLIRGNNKIDLLSLIVGLQNYGAFFDTEGRGVTAPVNFVNPKTNATFGLSSKQWKYQVGLIGESLGLSNGASTEWNSLSTSPKQQRLIWYKTEFNNPAGSDPLALNVSGMGKGEAWVNGKLIGRYWTIASPSGGCEPCDYRGRYNTQKCRTDCGNASQTLYHVPRSWLKQSLNTLVLFEETGGDPTQISLATRQIESVCAQVSELHPPPVDMWSSVEKGEKIGPMLVLECQYSHQVISSIKFASYGTPGGTCGSFSQGQCNSTRAFSVVKKDCVGSHNCTMSLSDRRFGDPCRGVMKSLAVEASCT